MFSRVMSHLALSSGDRDQLEELPALGVCVEHLHGMLSRLLNLGGVWTPVEPAAQQRHFFWVQHRRQSVMMDVQSYVLCTPLGGFLHLCCDCMFMFHDI